MARKFLYAPEDDIRLADNEPLPAIKGRKPLYVVWIAWPRAQSGEGWFYESATFHEGLYQKSVKELGWLKTGRPRNEQVMIYYNSAGGERITFRIPNIPGSPLALTWVEMLKGKWAVKPPPNPHCPVCGLEYFGEAGKPDRVCMVCFWKGRE